ncbi:MAG: YigZ family protein [Planctomycetota bacterium]
MLTHLRTVAAPLRHESEPVKGSRFVADVFPVGSRVEALERLEAVRAEFAGANHHCFAWRLDPEGHETRADDDGEPTHSAGAPILRMVEGRDLAGLLVVVTRWFGGTKLGVGGLIRAYGGAAGEALDRAAVVERPIPCQLELRFDYSVSSAVETLCARYSARVADSVYGADVRLRVTLAVGDRETFESELGEASAGRVQVERS